MADQDETGTRVPVLGGGEPVSTDVIVRGARNALGMRRRARTSVREVRAVMVASELVHHPMWIAKVLTYADRPPFSPKVTPNAVFVDAVSGYRGVLETMPAMDQPLPERANRPEATIATAEAAKAYVDAVLQKVNRQYMLRKPRHEIAELLQVALPLIRVRLDLDGGTDVVINGNTGAPETYMASLWGKDDWHDLTR